ncbi:unnamed protein product, partial [Oikopleura dioica]
MKELERARSIYERAIDVDHRCIQIWLRYAEMEMRNKQVNHARNVWDRAVTLLPRAQQLWYKYAYMEEVLQNVTACRAVFERWMEWEPDPQAWHSYINFEYRYKEYDQARCVYERFILCHPDVKNWMKYAKWEERLGAVEQARGVYERAIEFYGDEFLSEDLFIAFARFEERQREYERCRTIFKYALDNLAKDSQAEIFKYFSAFEKRFGSRQGIEDVVWNKRRKKYEDALTKDPEDYDSWFDYLRMVESEGDSDVIRDTYERAVANIPESPNKNDWRRYIYLWIMYALFEETEMGDIERTREVWKACLEILPHKKFTFSKIWLHLAHFEVRQKNLTDARRVLGVAIGKAPKDKLFREYIELELQLREFDRCRKLYQKFLEYAPANCTTWIKFAELETILGDPERARGIFELAITQLSLDMPEVLWKTYIDFEIDLEEIENARILYRRLLERTSHPKVWLAFAKFEQDQKDPESDYHPARDVYREASDTLRQAGAEKLERLLVLEQWLAFENAENDEANLNYVKFTFSKIWLHLAHFEVRQKNLTDARRVLGVAIGKAPKDKLFREYIELELQLREFDRCRKLYQKFLEYAPANCTTWIKFAELETILGDPERARGIFELAITQPSLDMPEVLWKTYIDFEIDLEEIENARILYRRLLERTSHPKVWLAFAKFEQDQKDPESDYHPARDVYREASDSLRQAGAEKLERLLVLEQWLAFENAEKDEANLNYVKSQMPRRVKKRRQLTTDTGADAGWEEYWDYIFPEDEVAKPNMNLLKMAK